jgi:hypothetical protein
MDVQDGFILGIYNYCDRWCERCRFTSRCRVFADGAEHQAAGSLELKAVQEAAPHPSDVQAAPRWLAELLDGVSEMPPADEPTPAIIPARDSGLIDLGNVYCDSAWRWLESQGFGTGEPADPIQTISHFACLIPPKTRRALTGLAEFDGCRDYPPDHEGSAKVALDGIDRSVDAWKGAHAAGLVTHDAMSGFVSKLETLRAGLEDSIPNARAFIRSAFDEPDEVRRLEATDWS